MPYALRWTVCFSLLALLSGAGHGAELRALVLSGANNHDWRTTTPEMVRQLEATGVFDVDVTNDPGSLSAAELRRYDVLVNNYNGPDWSETTRQAVLDYLADGGGMVVIHAADNAFPGWAEFESLIGIAWRGGAGHGTYHRYMVTIDDPTHPVLEGMPHFLHAADELYHNLTWGEGSEAVVIASAYSRPEEGGTGKVEPTLLANRWGKGRMFHTVMGHDVPSLQGSYHMLLLQRGAEWAATGRVTQPLPAELAAESWVDPEADSATQIEQWVGLGAPRSLAARAVNASTPAQRAEALLEMLQTDAPACHTVARQKLIWMGSEAVDTMVAAAGGELDAVLRADLTAMAKRSHQTVTALVAHARSRGTKAGALALAALTGARARGSVELFAGLLSDQADGDVALEALSGTPGREATEALMRATFRADEDLLSRLLRALGERADRRAASVLVRHSRDQRTVVRQAALEALGNLPTPASEVALRAAYSGNQTADLVATAGNSLLSIARAYGREGEARRSLDLVRLVLERGAWDGSRVAALATLRHVDDPGAFELARAHLADASTDVALAATDAVAAQSAPAADRVLIELLGSPDAAVRGRAITHLAARASDEGASALGAVVRDASHSEASRMEAAQSLGGMATPPALDALVASLSVGPTGLQSAVAAAAERVATGLVQGPHSALARSAARQLLESDGGARQAGLRVLAAAADARDRDLVQEALGDDDPATVRAAVSAAVAVGSALEEAGDSQAATELLMVALEALPAEAAGLGVTAGLAALGAGADLARRQGFLTDFHVVGPFPNPSGAGFAAVYPPEEGVDLGAPVRFEGSELAWTPFDMGDSSGIANLAPLVSPSQDVVVYAYTEIVTDRALEAVLKVGSDDGIVVWVNGERVHGVDAARPVQVDQDVLNVRLNRGANALLFKITQGGGDFGFVARLVDSDGRPVVQP